MADWRRCVAVAASQATLSLPIINVSTAPHNNAPSIQPSFQAIHPLPTHDSVQSPHTQIVQLSLSLPPLFCFSPSLPCVFPSFLLLFSAYLLFSGVVYEPLVIRVSLASARPVTSIMPLCLSLFPCVFWLPPSLFLHSSRRNVRRRGW